MATRTFHRTRVELLTAPLKIPGIEATLANVTRHYQEDTDTLIVTEYGLPVVEPLWGKTVATITAELTARIAQLDQQRADVLQQLTELEEL